jgi:hypothetical protein
MAAAGAGMLAQLRTFPGCGLYTSQTMGGIYEYIDGSIFNHRQSFART